MGWRLHSNLRRLCLVALLLMTGCNGLRLNAADGTPQSMYLARIHFATLAERDRLAGELDVWEVHRQEQYLIARLDAGSYLNLAMSGWRISPECGMMRQSQSALNLNESTLQQLCPL